MNYPDPILREIAAFSPLDVLLADIAVRIQLTPTDHQKAVEHYEAINHWLDREASPLHGSVQEFYTQGGFAIGATVARHSTDDEFDIDVMAQLGLKAEIDPETALSLMNQAIRGERGSRYYDKVERKTRCSTVHYNGMHLDVTPTIRLFSREARTGFIFHSKPSDPNEPKLRLLANPDGFARWFISMTPADMAFALFFEKRSLEYNRARLLAKSDATPVPDQMPAYRKARAVIALQLLKRWRNLGYDCRHPRLRRPPSVLLAFYVATNANRTRTLTQEVIFQAESIIDALSAADHRRETVRAFNPACHEDELTDRWPGDLAEQRLFISELRAVVVQMRRLQEGVPLSEMQRVLEELFGERPAREAVRKYMDQHVRDNAAGRSLHIPGRGAVPALGSLAAPVTARATPKSTPYGD